MNCDICKQYATVHSGCCGRFKYCGIDCAKSHWISHKSECIGIKFNGVDIPPEIVLKILLNQLKTLELKDAVNNIISYTKISTEFLELVKGIRVTELLGIFGQVQFSEDWTLILKLVKILDWNSQDKERFFNTMMDRSFTVDSIIQLFQASCFVGEEIVVRLSYVKLENMDHPIFLTLEDILRSGMKVAMVHNRKNVLEYLISKGGYISYKDFFYLTKTESLAIYLASKVDIKVDSEFTILGLRLFVRKKWTKALKILLARYKFKVSDNFLSTTVFKEDMQFLKFLLSCEANITFSKTTIQAAIKSTDSEVVKQMLKNYLLWKYQDESYCVINKNI